MIHGTEEVPAGSDLPLDPQEEMATLLPFPGQHLPSDATKQLISKE